jgi:hypothetical protein
MPEHRINYHTHGQLDLRLVPLFGTTGAGKSTLIRLLPQHPWRLDTQLDSSHNAFAKPINWNRDKSFPTSGNVHLYRDLYVNVGEMSRPLLLADCEGLECGSMLSAATRARSRFCNPDMASPSSLTNIEF